MKVGHSSFGTDVKADAPLRLIFILTEKLRAPELLARHYIRNVTAPSGSQTEEFVRHL